MIRGILDTCPGIDPAKPVQVYRNLHKPGCQFSVRQSGKVLGYVDSVCLTDVRFKHATAKQLLEVRTGARQVCQWITGTLSVPGFQLPANMQRVCCDPKTSDGFTCQGLRIDSATVVVLSSAGCFVGNAQ